MKIKLINEQKWPKSDFIHYFTCQKLNGTTSDWKVDEFSCWFIWFYEGEWFKFLSKKKNCHWSKAQNGAAGSVKILQLFHFSLNISNTNAYWWLLCSFQHRRINDVQKELCHCDQHQLKSASYSHVVVVAAVDVARNLSYGI